MTFRQLLETAAFVLLGLALAVGLQQIPVETFDDGTLLLLFIGLAPVPFMSADRALRYVAVWPQLAGVGGALMLVNNRLHCWDAARACVAVDSHRELLAYGFYALIGGLGFLLLRRIPRPRRQSYLARLALYRTLRNRGVLVKGVVADDGSADGLGYTFRVDGREYSGRAYPYPVNMIGRQLATSDEVTVCYDPYQPERSIFGYPGVELRKAAMSALGSVGIIFLMVYIGVYYYHQIR